MTASNIEWTEQVWNPLAGCSVTSPGCTNCYAMKMAYRLEAMAREQMMLRDSPLTHYCGTTHKVNGKAVWTGKIGFSEAALLAPLKRRKPTRWFVNSMSDLFHENVPDATIDRIFAVMALCPQHTFQVLTKRSARMREYFEAESGDWSCIDGIWREIYKLVEAGAPLDRKRCIGLPIPNVWLGVSVEDQTRADQRIPDLLATPAAVRFISAEPLLGPVDLEPWLEWPDGGCELPNGRYFGCAGCDPEGPRCDCPKDRAYFEVTEGPRDASGCPEWVDADRITLDWAICGGESGPGARPMHPAWARSLRDQCAAAGVPFFFKQWGEWAADNVLTDGSVLHTVQVPKEHEDPARRIAWPDGAITAGGHADHHGGRGASLARCGKKLAGRLLDGRTHDEFPTLAAGADHG